MKKSSKIWKITKYGYDINNDMYNSVLIGTDQLIYDSELDCILDIVTEPENQGLKVYKHSTRIIKGKDFGSEKKFIRAGLKELVETCKQRNYYPMYRLYNGYYWYSEDLLKTLDMTEYVIDSDCINVDGSYKFVNSYEIYEEHWVDCYMQ